MTVNEYLLKVQGSSPVTLQGALTVGQDVSLKVDGCVVKAVIEDNNDGTFNMTYIVKGVIAYDEL